MTITRSRAAAPIDFHVLLSTFLDLNDDGETLDTNPEYFRAGFELLADVCPWGTGDECRQITAALLYSDPRWFETTRRPFDLV